MPFILEADKSKYKKWGWYVLGIVWVFIAFVIGQLPLTQVIQTNVDRGVISQQEAADFMSTANFESAGISSAMGLLLILGSFIVGLLALYLFVNTVHGRKFKSLVTSGTINWRKIFFAFGLWFILTAIAEGVLYLLNPDVYRFVFEWKKWLPLMVVVLFLLPLQTSFEELFVRGYLFQGIGLAANRPWVAILVTSLIFGLMHITNPEVREFGLGLMMCYYISVGIFLASLTILDDGLEFALGIHAATNIYGAGFVTYAGSALQTDAMMKVDVVNPVWLLALFYFSVAIFIIIVHRRYKLRKWEVLFEPVKTAEIPIHPVETTV